MSVDFDDIDNDKDLAATGMVFNIQKYSVHDGPGIRTIVFTKGCALSCRWCSNPESQARQPQLAYNEGRCLGFDKCQHCLKACPNGAIGKDEKNKPDIDRSKCAGCDLLCAQACPAQGLIIYGKERSVKEVLQIVKQDSAFYARSGGGLTMSGGEPLLQDTFAIPLLRQARRSRLKTAIETCGMVPNATVRAAGPWLSNVMFDIKHMDPEIHKAQTGLDNKRIHENFRILVEEFPNLPIRARTPVIPGFNDSVEAISAIAEFLKPFERVEYELLPYHRLGTQKYTFLGKEPPMGEVQLDKSVMPKVNEAAIKILGDRLVNIKN